MRDNICRRRRRTDLVVGIVGGLRSNIVGTVLWVLLVAWWVEVKYCDK